MSSKAQKRRFRSKTLHEVKYERLYTIGNLCVYCGEMAQVLDHVPPITAAHLYKSGHIKVPACKSCNGYLASFLIISIEERKRYLLKRLTERYGKTLKIPKWDNKELSEIKGFVHGYIKKGIIKQRHIRDKLRILASTESFLLD